MSSLIPLHVQRGIARAKNRIFASQQQTGMQTHNKTSTIVIVVICVVVGVGFTIFIVYYIRRRRNRARVQELEDGPDQEENESIPLEDLPAPRGAFYRK
jgi:heme/copper-type cytochrome/quinol oxidase subunit 2